MVRDQLIAQMNMADIPEGDLQRRAFSCHSGGKETEKNVNTFPAGFHHMKAIDNECMCYNIGLQSCVQGTPKKYGTD